MILINDQLKSFKTPAFIYSEVELRQRAGYASKMAAAAGVRLLFPLKCHSVYGSLQIIADHVVGFAASSLFEARLAREILGEDKEVNFTSPGLGEDDVDAVISLCNGISFNSLSQWARFKGRAIGQVTCGLRINPQLSYVKDARYDPCSAHSRLGSPLEQVRQVVVSQPELLQGIEGVHVHTNCDSTDWQPLLETVQHLNIHIPRLLEKCKWINLGGGYLLRDDVDLSPLRKSVELLQNKYELNVIIEPGAGIVRDTCYLVAEVVDLFESDGMQVAILNTSVNHMPEVFEYQFSPDVSGDTDEGHYNYILAGATCLAGDVFGEYTFNTPLTIGSRVTFTGMGAYTLVKSHMFNGINLPTIYALTQDGELTLQKQFSYQDFRRISEPEHNDESVRNLVENPKNSWQRRSA